MHSSESRSFTLNFFALLTFFLQAFFFFVHAALGVIFLLATLLFLNSASLGGLHHQSLFAFQTVSLSLFFLLLDSELLSLLCFKALPLLKISLLLLLLLLSDKIIRCS